MIKADSCFSKGTGHQVCQDYACHIPELGIAAVSDGCSSSPHTDIGARALVLSALSLLQRPYGRETATRTSGQIFPEPFDDPFGSLILSSASNVVAATPGVPVQCLDATLGVLFTTPRGPQDDGRFRGHAMLWGDGIIIMRHADGEVCCWHQEYLSGAPYYLGYRLSNTRNKQYGEQFGKRIVETWIQPSEEKPVVTLDRSWSQMRIINADLEPGDTMLICTDGINQFLCNGKFIPWLDVAKSICDFKRFTGEYLKARMNFFDRECRKTSTTHGDDFAIATIHNDGLKKDPN